MILMLNSVNWKYFKLEDLFEISSGKRLKKMDHINGDIPYVSSTQYNNGVDEKIGNGYTHKNGISIGAYGGVGEAFYHPYKFWASDSVNVITPKDRHFNEYIGLFIVSIIKKEQYRYSYGRGLSCRRLTTTSIKLPIDSNGDPNWDFMEEYMKQLSKGNLDGFNLPKNDKRLKLDEREWDEFKLEDLFEIETGKDLIIKNIKIGDIPVISHSSVNNGVSIRSKFIKNRKLYNCAKSITLADRGTFYATVQAEDYYLGTRVKSLISKSDDSSIYSLIFISTIINQEKYRYNYGRNATHRLPETIIKLPIKPKSSPDENSEPDWKFMEDYIKGLPYTNKL